MKLEDLKNGIDNIKPDPYMETRLAQKVFEAAPKKRSKRRLAVAAISGILSLALIVTALGFGGFWQNIIPDDPNIDITEPITGDNNDNPEYLPSGGDGDIDYDRAYNWKVYTLSGLHDYIVENSDVDLDEWLQNRIDKMKELGYTVSSPEYVPLVLEVIEAFNIPKEDFERVNAEKIERYKSMGDDPYEYGCYTQEEIDALYSNNDATITKTFASDYAIISNGKAYAPAFYLNATQKELKQYGISTAEVGKKTELLLTDGIIETQK